MGYIAGLLVLSASFVGYLSLLCRFVKLPISFYPIIVLSSVALVGFMGGLAGLLDIIVVAMLFGGLAAFLVGWLGWRNLFFEMAKSPGIVFFGAFAVLNIVLFSNATLGHYDDFSHWGAIVKDMFAAHAYPGQESIVATVESFVNYPPITATFVYVVNLVVGYTEGHAIVAQNFLFTAGAASLFSAVEETPYRRDCAMQTVICACVAFSSFWFVLNDNDMAQFQTLLVDSVMGVCVVSAILLVIQAKDENLAVSCLAALPISLVAAFMKDNGKVFFLIVFATVIAVVFWQLRKSRASFPKSLIFAAAVGVVFCLALAFLSKAWDIHVESVFGAESEGKFSVSSIIDGEYQMPLFVAAKRVLHDAFLADLLKGAVFFGLNAALVILIVVSRKRRIPFAKAGMACLASNAVVFGTCIALIFLYTFMMPAAENSSDELAGFYRYYGSALLVFYCLQWSGILLQAFMLLSCSDKKNEKASDRLFMSFFTVCVFAWAFFTVPNILRFSQGVGIEHLHAKSIASPTYDSKREPISSVLDESSNYISPGQNVAVYYGDGARANYRWYLSMYETASPIYVLSDDMDAESLQEALANVDWMVLLGQGGERFLQERGVDVSPEGDSWFEIRHLDGKAEVKVPA